MPGTSPGMTRRTTPIAKGQLMDSLNPESPPVADSPPPLPPRVWKFWGTTLWGLFIFAAMFATDGDYRVQSLITFAVADLGLRAVADA